MRPKKSPAAKKSKVFVDPHLNDAIPYLSDHGCKAHLVVIIREAFHHAQPTTKEVEVARSSFKADARFVVEGSGFDTVIMLAGADQEPETVTAETPTIGEMADQAREAEKNKPAPLPIDPKHSEEHLKLIRVASAFDQEAGSDLERLRKQMSTARKRKKATELNLSEVIGGQGSILDPNGAVPKPKDAPKGKRGPKSKTAKGAA